MPGTSPIVDWIRSLSHCSAAAPTRFQPLQTRLSIASLAFLEGYRAAPGHSGNFSAYGRMWVLVQPGSAKPRSTCPPKECMTVRD